MDKKELIEQAGNPNHIPGIYNYCDRWCERCPFTSRCLTYAMEEDRKQKAENADQDHEQFWNSIQDSFDLAMSLLGDLAEEFGIDLDAAEVEEDAAQDNREHILTRMTDRYIKMVDGWIDRNHGPIGEVLERENSHLKVVRPEAEKCRIPLAEALEVIGYYKYFFGVKLMRALRGKDEEASFDFDDMPKDSDCWAKLALIAMDRSISAWGVLASYLPDHKSGAAEIIGRLKQIRDIAEKEFPEARSFARPGFDE